MGYLLTPIARKWQRCGLKFASADARVEGGVTGGERWPGTPDRICWRGEPRDDFDQAS